MLVITIGVNLNIQSLSNLTYEKTDLDSRHDNCPHTCNILDIVRGSSNV